MEIHFYESISTVPVNIIHDWESVKEAIDRKMAEIHTTQMCMLSNTLLHNNYRVFVHQSNGIMYEITLKSKSGHGDRAVRDSQNVYTMWASNVFRE